MIDVNKIPAAKRLKPLLEGLKIEMAMLDAERQLRETNIKSYFNEIDIAIAEVNKL